MTEISIGAKYEIGDEIVIRLPITHVTVVHSKEGSAVNYSVKLPVGLEGGAHQSATVSQVHLSHSDNITVRKKEEV